MNPFRRHLYDSQYKKRGKYFKFNSYHSLSIPNINSSYITVDYVINVQKFSGWWWGISVWGTSTTKGSCGSRFNVYYSCLYADVAVSGREVKDYLGANWSRKLNTDYHCVGTAGYFGVVGENEEYYTSFPSDVLISSIQVNRQPLSTENRSLYKFSRITIYNNQTNEVYYNIVPKHKGVGRILPFDTVSDSFIE